MAGYYGFHVGHLCVRPSVWTPVCQSYIHPALLLFPDDSLSKCQWILTKLGMCFDIVEIWFLNANGQISIFFKGSCQPHNSGGVLLFTFLFLI